MEEINIYETENYKLTNKSFTYHGYTESLKNIADLEVIESGVKGRAYEAIGLATFGLFWSTIPAALAAYILAPQYALIIMALFVLVFFLVGYYLRAKYTLYIVKCDGDRGPIDKSRQTRADFDVLIAQLKTTIIEYC